MFPQNNVGGKTDENYEEAQSKLELVYVDYISSVVASAKKYNESKKYENAIKQINTAYDILPDDTDSSALKFLLAASRYHVLSFHSVLPSWYCFL